MKKILAAAAIAGSAGLTACSVATPAPGTGSATSSSALSQPAPSRSSDAAAPQAGGAEAACERFNALYAEYQAIQADANAYEDIYFAAQDAKDAAAGNLKGLFTSLSVLSLDHSLAVGGSGEVEQASRDLVRDAVFANAPECTAAGVTLRL